MTTDTQQKILDAVDAGFDAQLATTRDFVAIPSTRGAEGPCQDMIGDLLRQRGYEVDDWHIDVEDLKDLRGFGPIEHDFSKAHSKYRKHREIRFFNRSFFFDLLFKNRPGLLNMGKVQLLFLLLRTYIQIKLSKFTSVHSFEK